MKQLIIILFGTCFVLFGGWAVVRAAAVSSVTLTVTETSDLTDLTPGDGLCDVSATAGEQCSLRAAIEELNALGPDVTPHRIEFNLTGSSPFTITPGTGLPDIHVPVQITGDSQPGAACPSGSSPASLKVVLDGSSLGGSEDGLLLGPGSDGSTIRGLVIGNFTSAGIRIVSADNKVRCSHIGLGADGVTTMGNSFYGIHIGDNNNVIGGLPGIAQRNVISANGLDGIRITSAEDNWIANNFIGTTANGLNTLGNTGGIYVSGNNNIVGGAAPLTRNMLSGNNSYGLRINSGESNIIRGNYIGVARDGLTPLPNLGNGLELIGEAALNTIGGPLPGEGNLIANNGGIGIILYDSLGNFPVQNTLRGNKVTNNVGLGIDLGSDGVDTNDPDDVDGGENEHQNYPVLGSTPNSTVITGTLDSQANTEYIVDIYRSDSCDTSGHGEGEIHLVEEIVNTDATGSVELTIDLTGLVFSGDSITATATDPSGNTSEFSACVSITLPVTPTPTLTATPTPSATPTNTLTPTPSPTTSFTPTPGPSATPSPTTTASPSPTTTNTPTPGPSATPSNTATSTPSPSPTLPGAPSPTPTFVPEPTTEPPATPTAVPGEHTINLPFVNRAH